jgi:hypothetical protein
MRPLLQCRDKDSTSFFAVCKKRKAVFARLFYAAATLEISWHVHGKKLDYAVEKFVACFRELPQAAQPLLRVMQQDSIRRTHDVRHFLDFGARPVDWKSSC